MGCLVLSRRLKETVVIAESITVTVTSIKGGVVRLAFEAPKTIPIRRAELEERKAG